MGAHALGAAAYAAKAVSLSAPDDPYAMASEIQWQVKKMSKAVRDALLTLPAVGEDRSGPLGPGLLASGQMLQIMRALQAQIADPAVVDSKRDQVDLL